MKWDPIDRPSDTVYTRLIHPCCLLFVATSVRIRFFWVDGKHAKVNHHDENLMTILLLSALVSGFLRSARSQCVAYVYYWIFEYKSDKCLHCDPLAEELSHTARQEASRKIKQQRETSLFSYNIDFRSTLSHVSVRFRLPRAFTAITATEQHVPISIRWFFFFASTSSAPHRHAISRFLFILNFSINFFSRVLSVAFIAAVLCAVRPYACGDWWRLTILL